MQTIRKVQKDVGNLPSTVVQFLTYILKQSMFLGMGNEIIKTPKMFNKDITIADGHKRYVCVDTSDSLINATFHLGNRISSGISKKVLSTSLPQLTQGQLSLL
jgi:hypothetical protein